MTVEQEEFCLSFLHSFVRSGKFRDRTFIFGGYLRDKLLNLPIGDMDLLMVGTEDDGALFATEITKQTGDFVEGTNPTRTNNSARFYIIHKGEKIFFDVTSEPAEPDETYHQAVARSTVQNRDFAINGMFVDLTSLSYIDPARLGIRAFLDRKLVTVSEDYQRIFFRHPVRIYRMFRFMAKTGFQIPRPQLDYIRKNAWIANFVEWGRVIEEYKAIQQFPHARAAFQLMRETGVDPTDKSRADVFLGMNWHECEPGQEPNRIQLVPHYRWTNQSAFLYVNDDVEAVELVFSKNGYTPCDVLKCYFNDDPAPVKFPITDHAFTLKIPTSGVQKIRINTDTFTPSSFNIPDGRRLGIYVSHINTYKQGKRIQNVIDNIPYYIPYLLE